MSGTTKKIEAHSECSLANYFPPDLSPDGMEDEADALREELHKAAKEFSGCDAIAAGFTKYSRSCNRLENAAIAYGRLYSVNADVTE